MVYYTAGQAAKDLAILAGWVLLGAWGIYNYWSTNSEECGSCGGHPLYE